MPDIQVGDRVRYIGPDYVHASNPAIGALGTLVAREGHYAQIGQGPPEELVTVQFDFDDRPWVIRLCRIARVEEGGGA